MNKLDFVEGEELRAFLLALALYYSGGTDIDEVKKHAKMMILAFAQKVNISEKLN